MTTATYSEKTERLLATYEAVNRRDIDAVFAETADDYVLVDHAQRISASGIGEARVWMEAMLAGSSDLVAAVANVYEAGDVTVVQVVATGTNDGEFGGIPATGQSFTLEQCEVHRFDADGKIAESHIYYDMYGLLAQLGVVPALAGV